MDDEEDTLMLGRKCLSVVVWAGWMSGLLTWGGPSLAAQAMLPELGCPMAHCDTTMSDQANLSVPLGTVDEVWHRNEMTGEQAGSRLGLGCSANGQFVACSYSGATDNLVAYDYHGNRLWSSGSLLNQWAWTSAPLIDNEGAVIGCDNLNIIKFDVSGGVVWTTGLPAGTAGISPVLTEDGILVLATIRGPIYTIDHASGALLDTLYLKIDDRDEGFFGCRNTPSVKGNRVYLPMEHIVGGAIDENDIGWLAAVDVGTSTRGELTLAWHYAFGSPSGASPLRVGNRIYFDVGKRFPGTGPADPHIVALLDFGAFPIKLWEKPTATRVVASFARDPRGGLWQYSQWSPWLVRRHLWTGDVIGLINVNEFIDGSDVHVLSSAMTIAESGASPVMIVTASSALASSTVLLGIDLVDRACLWAHDLSDGGSNPPTGGQFPIVDGVEGPRIVFSLSNTGARAIGSSE